MTNCPSWKLNSISACLSNNRQIENIIHSNLLTMTIAKQTALLKVLIDYYETFGLTEFVLQ